MTLEQRLSAALHEVDGFEPSPDLYARVRRSLEEDTAYRRRMGIVWLAAVASIAVVVAYLGLLITRSPGGVLLIPTWAVELLETLVLVALVLVLAPIIRRFGGIYVSDVFRLDPGAGTRFLRLLDIAYYLVFFAVILLGVSLVRLDRMAPAGPALDQSLVRVGVLVLVMGLFHAATLLALPVIGLVFSSSVRRVERRRAGAAAPEVSSRALQADRVVSWIVWLAAGLILVGAFVGVGIVIGRGVAG
jgi:hypothetical protein